MTKPSPNKTGLGTILLLGIALAGAVLFLIGAAFPYLTLNEQRFGPYWPKRGWLLMHIAGGSVALSLGPFVLWLGLNRRRMTLHRALGVAYMSSIAFSSIAAFYLATHTTFGWVFGAGLTGLAIAWIVTTSLALVSIRRRLIAQHKEWMIRSYVVTFAFVNFRIAAGILQAAGVGTLPEQLALASWVCWAVPLLITEALLQGRKILAANPERQTA
jgi:Predicted membrane protein (DUF2306)